MEVANDQTNDEAAVDAALEDQSVMTSSESERLSNDQVISMLVGETTNAVTQIVGDNIDIVKYCLYNHSRNNPLETIPSTRWVESKSPLQHHLCQIHRQQKLSPG